jgi:hypothetical protein
MSEYIKNIKEYSEILKDCCVWHNSKEILAPVITQGDDAASTTCYVYEFYCYICVVIDLKTNYEISFCEGKGNYKFKFPQAAANKEGKPKFIASKDGKIAFQICAGTKIDCDIDSEENHPDISFQKPHASDKPTSEDLILIMDAKFKENKDALPKSEVYKFGLIVDLYDLREMLAEEILFDKFKGFEANCLITNGKAYSNPSDVRLLKKYGMKEIEDFLPNSNFKIIG